MSSAPAFGLTVATCLSRHLAAKKFFLDARGDEQVSDYASGRDWLFQQCEFADLADLAKLLIWLAGEPRRCILRGEPVIDNPNLWQARRWASEPATLRSSPRQWLALDIDGALVPTPLGRGEHLAEAAEFFRDRFLPAEFRGVRSVVTATASTGRRGDTILRCRLWCLLDRPIPDADLYSWAKAFRGCANVPIDPAVLQTGQPNYTARPVFTPPLTDPLPEHVRVTILPGCDDFVALDLTTYAEDFRTIERETAAKIRFAGGNWRAGAQAAIGGHNSFYEPIKQVIGRAIHEEAATEEIVAVISKIIAERADPARRQQYNSRWLRRQVVGIRRLDERRYGVGGPAWPALSPERIAELEVFSREYLGQKVTTASETATLDAFAREYSTKMVWHSTRGAAS